MKKNQAKTTCLLKFTDIKQRGCGRLLQRLATFLVLFLCSMTISWAQGTTTGSNGKLILYDAKSPEITLNSDATTISQLSFTIKVSEHNAEQEGTHLETYYTYTTDDSDPEVSTNSTKLDGKSVVVKVDWAKGKTVKVRAFTMRIEDNSDPKNYDESKVATQDFYNTGSNDIPCVDDPVITPGDQAVVKEKLEVTIDHDQWTKDPSNKLKLCYIIHKRNEDGTITSTDLKEATEEEWPVKLTLTQSSTVRAYAKFTENGVTYESPKVSRTYILLDGATTYLNGDNTKEVGSTVEQKQNDMTIMTMTYGGIADGTNNFTRFTNVDYSEDNILGSLHAVTNTTLYLNKDAMSEKKDIEDYYSHKKASKQERHERTFGLPAKGSFYKFEPEANGELTVFVEQQGAMPKSEGQLFNTYVRKRPVYFLDEAGNSIKATYAYTSSKINKADWEKIKKTTFKGDDADFLNTLRKYYQDIIDGNNKLFTDINSAVAEADKRKPLTLGTSIQPIIVLNQRCNEGILEEDANCDDTGYMTISEGYVTYKFPVKAGKTYYLFASGTKLALSGFRFKQDESYKTENLQKVTLEGNNNNTDNINKLELDKQYNVTLNRSFGSGKWYSVVLPFSVSQKQMKSVFGKDVKVLHYNDVTGTTLNLFKHYYQMIVGGTPVLVKPSQEVTNPVFNNVTLTSKTVVDIVNGDFKCTGSWDNVDYPKYSYFINAKDSKFYLYDPKQVASGTKAPHAGAFRTWIISTSNNPSAAKKLTMRINGIEDNSETTAIWNAVIGNDDNAEVASKGIYSLSGQKMNVTDIRSLSKGIYIVNGKKYIVK